MTRGTTRRSIRMDDDFWQEVQAGCAADGINVSELVRGLLRGWLDSKRDNEGEK